MPPKKPTKTEKKKKEKSVEDKTFGMKNKNKSAKVQRYIAQVTTQAKHNATQGLQSKAEIAAEKKALEAKKKAEFLEQFKPVQVPQKVPFGVDPKTVLCQYFKAGTCERGAKCKFSHDLNVGRKVEKKDLYTDDRADDTMDNWDQKKLEEVVQSKSGKQPPTDIVCKHFLEAIETSKYGWFWECPNGGTSCKYRHALPPGFILRSKAKLEEKEEISLEEFLESERHKLGPNLTPVTLESFQTWKKNRIEKKEADDSAERKAKENKLKAGRSQGMSGRDLFAFNPALAQDYDNDDDDVFDISQYDRAEAEKERERIENEKFLSQNMANLSVEQ